MTESPAFPPERRAEWLAVLAQSAPADLARIAGPVLSDHRFEWLRRPEQGLVMVRARIGNTGDRFNLGEATVTRCAVRLQRSAGTAVVGVGHVLGRDAERAERVAQLDALLQLPDLHDLLWRTVVERLRGLMLARRRDELAQAEATRVRFFTLMPEAA